MQCETLQKRKSLRWKLIRLTIIFSALTLKL